jgi:hypothetical protein
MARVFMRSDHVARFVVNAIAISVRLCRVARRRIFYDIGRAFQRNAPPASFN